MGKGIIAAQRDILRKQIESKGADSMSQQETLQSFDDLSSQLNLTNLALNVIDQQILARATETIRTEFAGQPQVRAALLQTVATTSRELGLFEAAMPLQEEALKLRQEKLGIDHADTLVSMDEMGLLLQRLGKHREAESFHRGAVEGMRRTLGEEHTLTIKLLSSLGSLLYWLGNMEESLPIHQQVLEAQRRLRGEDHSDTLVAMSNLSILLQELGQFDEAEAYRLKVLDGQRRLLGEDHPHTLIAQFNLGCLYQEKKDYAQALNYYQRTFEADRRVLGDDHPDTLTCMNAVAMMLERLGREAEAEPYLRATLESRRRTLGDNNRDTCLSVHNLGKLLNNGGRHDEAAQLLEEYEPMARQVGVDGLQRLLGMYLWQLGTARAGKKQYAVAEETLLESITLISNGFGADHERTINAISSLADLYVQWHTNQPEKNYDAKAAEWRRRLAKSESPVPHDPPKQDK